MRLKNEITKFCNKLSMKVNLLVVFNREKYNLNHKSHIYKIKTIRRSRPEVFCENGVLKICQNSQENTCAIVSFLIKLQASSLY